MEQREYSLLALKFGDNKSDLILIVLEKFIITVINLTNYTKFKFNLLFYFLFKIILEKMDWSLKFLSDL